MNREQLITYLFCTYLLISFLACHEWYMKIRNERIRKLAGWAVVSDYCPALGRLNYYSGLTDDLFRYQVRYSIPSAYRITVEMDRIYLLKIIAHYQTEIARKYFLGRFNSFQHIFRMEQADFFMITFHDYLVAYEDCLERYAKECAGIQYDDPNIGKFYLLFYKLYFNTHTYCKNSVLVNSSQFPQWNSHIEEYLVSRIESYLQEDAL